VSRPAARRLAARPPFDGPGLLAHFASRAVPGVEAFADGEYRRSIRLPGGPAVVGLSPEDAGVRCRAWGAPVDDVAGRVAALLDLELDPAAVEAALGADPLIGPLVRASPGRRVPGAVDGAELAVRAVLGQQVSVAGAATVAGRLTATLGEPLPEPVGTVTHLFPSAAALASVDPASLPMPRSRGRALVGLCAALAAGDVDLRPGADPDAAEAALVALPGIGPWTAAYVRLRALGDRDAFPAADLGIRRALERLGADGRPGPALALAERWRPLRAYAAQHLWALDAQYPAPASTGPSSSSPAAKRATLSRTRAT
jgi:AraC family transcriptional regulator of adaptative response / DNA-3-methyladenine glycosylase II